MISIIHNSKWFKIVASFLLLNIICEIFFPLSIFALTSGPTSPEFSTFTPVTTTDMVNPFSGDFSYNIPIIEIPGPHGSGYPLSLAYNAGGSAESEASWVGFGWNLNPGSIQRNTRGYPDDYKNVSIDRYNKVRKDWTVTFAENFGVDIFKTPVGLGASSSVRYNNYSGAVRSFGLSVAIKGIGNLGLNVSGSEFTLNAGIDPGLFRGAAGSKHEKKEMKEVEKNLKEKPDVRYVKKKPNHEKTDKVDNSTVGDRLVGGILSNIMSTTGIHSYSEDPKPTTIQATRGYNLNFSHGLTCYAYTPVGLKFGESFAYSEKEFVPKVTDQVYGYMYHKSYDALTQNFQTDYTVEKSTPYSKRDLFLGIPFNNYDIFSVQGEGLSGGFRIHHSNIGIHRPGSISSDTKGNLTPIFSIGFTGDIANPVGIGIDLGVGVNLLAHETWSNPVNGVNKFFSNYDLPSNATKYFRFNNDLGGAVEYSGSNPKLEVASLEPLFPLNDMMLGAKLYKPEAVNFSLQSQENQTNAGRVNYIEYKTNSDFTSSTFSNDPEINNTTTSSINYTRNSLGGDGLGGYQITNASGSKYIYELPVYNKQEYQLQYNPTAGAVIQDNYLLYHSSFNELTPNAHINSPEMEVVGEYKATPYASQYLLTHVLGANYFDKTNNGPTKDDFGSWTKFDYKLKHGGNGDWYRWRSPYNGLLYGINQNSDLKDDNAGFQTGLKEVHYLKTIETATHIAFFITNSTTIDDFDLHRILDGYGTLNSAPSSSLIEALKAKDPLNNKRLDGISAADNACAQNAKGNKELEYLERIVLFSKSELLNAYNSNNGSFPIKQVIFEYDYSLVPNLPNTNGTSTNTGKLTLKKMWTEYQGVKKFKISPYEFKYYYKKYNEFKPEVLNRYGFITDPHSVYGISNIIQNLPYSPFSTDGWGAVQNPFKGKERFEKQLKGVSQAGNDGFDFGAYQLKQIVLPTGGEILVEYEQDDYKYVQDRKATALVSLTNDSKDDYNAGVGEYYLNFDEIMVTSSEASAYCNLLKEHFVTNEERVYFKFLYALSGSNPILRDRNSEYISGYAEVEDVSLVNNQIRFKLKGAAGEKVDIPRKACYQYVVNNKGAKIGAYGDRLEYDKNAPFIDKAAYFADFYTTMKTFITPIKTQVCKEVNFPLSYLKVPLFHAKKGGGTRVKRIMMYDDGVENGDAHLYGQEYLYQLPDGSSSGVTTNEPAQMREDNALVTQIKRSKQSWLNRLLYGKDLKVSEGPIGETVIQAPAVGYSRVVVKSIHDGLSSSGFTIHEFFTAKDYPYDKNYSFQSNTNELGTAAKGVDFTSIADTKVKDYMIIPTPYFSYNCNKVWLSQGFRFIVNSMHGQPKKFETYGGAYGGQNYLIASQEYTYFEPGEKIKYLQYNVNNNVFSEGYYSPGKEEDVCIEMQGINDYTFDFNFSIGIDITISMTPVIWVYPGGFQVNLVDGSSATHTMSKVISYPAIMKQKKIYAEGITSTEEYLAFNKDNGQPIVTKTYDEYSGVTNGGTPLKGIYYNANVPASWFYAEMGQKAKNSNAINMLSTNVATFTTYAETAQQEVNANMSNADWWTNKRQNLIAANLNSYKPLNTSILPSYIQTEYGGTSNMANYFVPYKNYKLLSAATSANGSLGKVYKGGIMTNSFGANDIKDILVNDISNIANWQKITETKVVNYNGEVLEEVNALNIPSSAKFGYFKTLPTIIAQNAPYQSILFESFEDESFVGTNSIATTASHCGKKSIELSSSAPSFTNNKLSFLASSYSTNINSVLLTAWVKTDNISDLLVSFNGTSTQIPFEKIAEINGWSLISTKIQSLVPGSSYQLLFQKKNNTNSIYIDDVKVLPLDAEGKCFVYDPITNKLVAELNSNHFAIFYLYNDEGQLIRKNIETEKGIKTVTETFYNTKSKLR